MAKNGIVMNSGLKTPPAITKDSHHICFQKKHWRRGYARAIRMAFAREVPVAYHRQLHQEIKGVPVPPADMLRRAWVEYEKDKEAIDAYDVCIAAAWLYAHIPDEGFRKGVQHQIDFFATQLYK